MSLTDHTPSMTEDEFRAWAMVALTVQRVGRVRRIVAEKLAAGGNAVIAQEHPEYPLVRLTRKGLVEGLQIAALLRI